ncbi:MAG: YtxH domain-containing protein [Bacteroidales bacterium]|nr:YtxH domain-containing protein [Bacteroidales bacterium]
MNTGKSILAFVAGAAVGAVAALLMAPDSGAKTREKIRSGAADAAGMAKDKIIEGLDMLEAALEEK